MECLKSCVMCQLQASKGDVPREGGTLIHKSQV